MNSWNKKSGGIQCRIGKVALCLISLSLLWGCVSVETPEETTEQAFPMSFEWGDDVYTQTDEYYSEEGNEFEKVGTWNGYEVFKSVGDVTKDEIGYSEAPEEPDLTTLYIKVGDKYLAYEKEDLDADI